MQNNANDPTPSHSTPTKPTFFSFLKRVILAFLLTSTLLAGYIWLHIPFSYLDANGAAITSISAWYDILATLLIAVIAAFVIGRVSLPRWPRLVLLLMSSLILLTFIFSCAELLYFKTNPEWVGVVEKFSWIEPFRRDIPSDLSGTIDPENFTGQGVVLSFLTAANTFRELNWYWIVVPIVDPEFISFRGWLPIIELNLIFSMVLTLVGGATAVIVTALHDVAKSIEFTNRILEGISVPIATMFQNLVRPLYGPLQALKNKVIKSEQPYTPPYRSHRGHWSSLPKRFAWGMAIAVIFSLVLFTSAIFANSRIPHLTWETQSIYIPSHPHIYALLPLDNGTLLAGTDEGVFRSDDGGKNWQATLAGLPNERVKQLRVYSKDGTLFAGTSDGVFRSDDGGRSWQTASNGLTDTDIQALVLDSGTLFVGTKKGGVFRSDDGGRSWQTASNGLTNMDVQTLALDLVLGTLFAGTNGGLFRSDDGGRSWQAASEGLTNTDVQTLLLDQATGALFTGTDEGGVFRSDDGGRSWKAANVGLTNTSVWALAIDPKDGILLAGTSGGMFRSADEGRSWQTISAGLTNTIVSALAADQQGRTLFAGISGWVFRSDDGGRSWQAASAGLTNTYVRVLVLEPQEGTLFAGTWGGVFRSDDGGHSWQAVSAGLTDTEVSALALKPQEGTLFAGTWGGGIFRSDDEGRSWQAASEGLTNTEVSALALEPQERRLFAGTWGGVFRSHNEGRSWQAASEGLTNTNVSVLVLEPKEGTLFAGTWGGGYSARMMEGAVGKRLARA